MTQFQLEVKGPTPGKATVEHEISVRSGDKITTTLIRVEHVGGGPKNNDRKDAGNSRKPPGGRRVAFQDTQHRKSQG